jgi:hypothetical protein
MRRTNKQEKYLMNVDGSVLMYYQPQVDAWQGYKMLMARTAVSVTPGNGKQVFEVASLQAGFIINNGEHTGAE